MKQRRRMVVRIAVGVVLVLVAMGISYVIRDVLASRNPVSGLPILHVQYADSEAEIPAENTMLASYSWRFVNKTVEWEHANPEAWRDELEPFPAVPGAALDISFSFPCKSMKVSRWYIDRNGVPAGAEVLTEPFSTPFSGGTYVYRVEAEWGGRGSVQYYFKIKL